MWMPYSDLDESARTLNLRERSLSLSYMVNKSNTFAASYWYTDEVYPWTRLYGRQILKHMASLDPEAVNHAFKEEPVWDYFHEVLALGPKPWFMENGYWLNNQQGRLLRMDWEGYKDKFPRWKQPPKGFPQLIPGRIQDTWLHENQYTNLDPQLIDRLGYLPKHFKRGW